MTHYAGTCYHVIKEHLDNPGAYNGAFIRVNDSDGVAQDIPISPDDWEVDPVNDVAVAHVSLPRSIPFWSCPLPVQELRVLPGHDVFFVGMFAMSPGFESVEAIVRTGKLARLATQVSIQIPGEPEPTEIRAYLAEVRSWGGESGSPVFVYDEHYMTLSEALDSGFGNPQLVRSAVQASSVTPQLLGVFHGHYMIPQPVIGETPTKQTVKTDR